MSESSGHAPRRIEGVVSVDQLAIRWQGWVGKQPPRAVFLIVHGLAEHSGRYVELVGHFNRVGVACYGLDLRGHGHSDGRRVHVDHFDDYQRDVAAVREVVAERHPDLPLFLVGHSMGGLIVLRYVLSRPDDQVGAILSSPGLAAHPRVRPGLGIRLLAKLLRKIAPRFQVRSGLPASLVSRDPDVVEAYEEDPLVSSTASSGFYFAMLEAQRDALERAPTLAVPILLMQSGDDRLVDPAATEAWVRAAPTQRVTYHRWTGLYHEMFHEPERERVFEFTEEWLDRRLGMDENS